MDENKKKLLLEITKKFEQMQAWANLECDGEREDTVFTTIKHTDGTTLLFYGESRQYTGVWLESWVVTPATKKYELLKAVGEWYDESRPIVLDYDVYRPDHWVLGAHPSDWIRPVTKMYCDLAYGFIMSAIKKGEYEMSGADDMIPPSGILHTYYKNVSVFSSYRMGDVNVYVSNGDDYDVDVYNDGQHVMSFTNNKPNFVHNLGL